MTRATASHPALAAEAAALRAARARADREGLPSPWTAGADLENVAGTGALTGVRSAEATLRLGRVLELGGKREARQALGEAEVDRQAQAALATRIEIASRTTARYIEVVADQERLVAAQARVTQAERTRREIASWVAAARNPESDLRAAEIALAEAELEREHAEHELAAAKVSLSASWGALAPDFERVAGTLQPLPEVAAFDVLAARLPQAPVQRAMALETAEAEARRRLAATSATPDVNLSVGVRRLETFGDQALVMSMSVPLGTKSRARFAIAEADAQLAAIGARRDAQRLEAHQALFATYQELLHARTEYASVHDRMLPKAEQALAFTRRGFAAGRFSFLALAKAQDTVFELRARSVEAAARYHTLLVEVERLTAISTDTTP